ncbi:S-adenosyl-L-methionine-dependent methyltransferase [Gongronella butleri]|nr:S-adenosyl-L-methionine-dependent methyltransferase [Gongronella butleri]
MLLAAHLATLPLLYVFTDAGLVRDVFLYAHAVIAVVLYNWPPPVEGTYGLRHFWLNLHAPRSLWCNMGYWPLDPAATPTSFAHACEHLVRMVIDPMEIQPGQAVLDVAYGCGDSCFYIADHYKARVTGITNEQQQWQVSMDRLHALPEPQQRLVQLKQGSATALAATLGKGADASFDRVVCVDAAYHFETREQFLQQAAQQLVPRGRIGLYDLVLGKDQVAAWWWRVLARIVDIPVANWIDKDEYEAQLLNAGFKDVVITPLNPELVFGGIANHCFHQLAMIRQWHMGHWSHAAYLRFSGHLFAYLARGEFFTPVLVHATKAPSLP